MAGSLSGSCQSLAKVSSPAREQAHVKSAFGGPACGTVSAQCPGGAKIS